LPPCKAASTGGSKANIKQPAAADNGGWMKRAKTALPEPVVVVDVDGKENGRGAQPSSGGGDVCYKCQQPGHWARDCPGAAAAGGGGGGAYGGGGGGAAEPARDDPPPKECGCGAGMCSMLTSRSERNPNRRFYTCPKPRDERCGFFEWIDPAPGMGAVGALGGGGGGGAYGGGGVGGSGAPPPAQGGASGGGGGGDVCYKCQQPGHWARDCPGAAQAGGGGTGGAYGGGGGAGGATGGGGGGGVCYKCQQPGHWARDCPGAAAAGGGGGGGAYGGGGGGGGYRGALLFSVVGRGSIRFPHRPRRGLP